MSGPRLSGFRQKSRWAIFVCCAAPCLATLYASQTKPSLPAVRTDMPPVIDGDLFDACWQGATRTAEFVDEFWGTPPADATEAWLCYDEKNIYVAFRAHESQPDRIVARETKEERSFRGEDTVTLVLDPFHTHRFTDHCLFTVNAKGAHSSNIMTGRGTKTEWRGEWQSAAKIGINAWTAELAIPWAMLNYPPRKEPLTMGLNFTREQARTKVVWVWAYLGQRNLLELEGHWEGVRPPHAFNPHFSVLPYGLAQVGQHSKATAGLDVRGALTPSLTAVFTANPDFSTVERAVEGIDFSYAERFVPERRPFFLEGEEFYTEFTSIGRFFYAQRIPDFDTGLNVYGKVAPKTSLGVLGAFDVDQRTDFMLRGRQELSETDSMDVSYLGREDTAGNNHVLVAKPVFRRGGLVLVTHWAQSLVEHSLAGDALNADLSYRGKHFGIGQTFNYVTPTFRDDLGQIPFTDYRGSFSWLLYENEWRQGPFRRLLSAVFYHHQDHYDGRPFRRHPAFYLNTETRNDWGITLKWDGGQFEQYHDNVFEVRLVGRVSDKFHNYGLGVQFGRQAGEDLLFLTPHVTWRFGERFTVGAASSILAHREDRQQHIFTVNYDLDKARSIGGRLVQQDGRISAFVSFRRSGYKGIDYYVIFGDPDPVKRFTPQLLVKVVVPF